MSQQEYTFQDFLDNVPSLTDSKHLGKGKTIKGYAKTDGGDIPLNKGYVTVMFYAHWCGHCKDLAPIYTKAYIPIRHSSLMCRVDSESPDTKGLMERFEIHGFPTVLRFIDGELEETYEGKRQPFELMCYAVGLDNHSECSKKYPDIKKKLT